MNKDFLSLYIFQLKQYAAGEFLAGVGYFLAALVLLFLAKLLRDVTTIGIDDDAEITNKDNFAFGLYSAGYYLGVGLVFTGVFLGDGPGFWANIIDIFIYGITGIVFMATSYAISDKVYLRKVKVMEQLQAGNTAVAMFLLGRFLFAGLITFAALHGEGSWFVCFVYYILGEVACAIGFKAYCIVTPYDDIKAIEGGNDAVGIVSAGFLTAIGLLALNSLWGDFLGYDIMLINFGAWFLGGLVLLLIFRSIGSRILLPRSSLVKEIHEDKNKGAAAIMLVAYLVIATVIVLSF